VLFMCLKSTVFTFQAFQRTWKCAHKKLLGETYFFLNVEAVVLEICFVVVFFLDEKKWKFILCTFLQGYPEPSCTVCCPVFARISAWISMVVHGYP